MVFEVSDIIRDVRVAIDNNDTSLQMPNNLIDIDTLTLEQIIESKVADAARVVESTYPVSEAITEEDEEYAMQRSRYAGIKGSPQKPVVAVVQQPIGLVLEFYSCYSGEHAYIKRARYIPIPRVVDGTIDLCEKLRPAIVYYTAYMVALSIKDGDLATAMLNQSKELMQ